MLSQASGRSSVRKKERQCGSAALGGTFRLSFRGAITNDIAVTNGAIAATDVQNALNALPTVPGPSNVGVTVAEDFTINSAVPNGHLFRVTFTIPELQGNVQAIEVVPSYNLLTGSDAAVTVMTDGLETPQQRGFGLPSVRGNEVSGQFAVTYRGWTTAPIDFDASTTQVHTHAPSLHHLRVVRVP